MIFKLYELIFKSFLRSLEETEQKLFLLFFKASLVLFFTRKFSSNGSSNGFLKRRSVLEKHFFLKCISYIFFSCHVLASKIHCSIKDAFLTALCHISLISQCFIIDDGTPTVFENHRKSLIQHCERSELRLHFERTKVN